MKYLLLSIFVFILSICVLAADKTVVVYPNVATTFKTIRDAVEAKIKESTDCTGVTPVYVYVNERIPLAAILTLNQEFPQKCSEAFTKDSFLTQEVEMDASCKVKCGHTTCPCPNGAQCTNDTDCSSSNICDSNTCVVDTRTKLYAVKVTFSRDMRFSTTISSTPKIVYDAPYISRLGQVGAQMILSGCANSAKHMYLSGNNSMTFVGSGDRCGDIEEEAFKSAVNSKDPQDFEEYMNQFIERNGQGMIEGVRQEVTVQSVQVTMTNEFYPLACFDAYKVNIKCYSASMPECNAICPTETVCDPKHGKETCGENSDGSSNCLRNPLYDLMKKNLPDGSFIDPTIFPEYQCRPLFKTNSTSTALLSFGLSLIMMAASIALLV